MKLPAKVDHIAFVVQDLESAIRLWSDSLGLELDRIEEIEGQESLVAFLPGAGAEIELVQPTTEDSGIARFLRKRGPGFHHICFEVEDIQTTLADLKQRGLRLINESATVGGGGKLVAFIHPDSTGGVLIELSQPVGHA